MNRGYHHRNVYSESLALAWLIFIRVFSKMCVVGFLRCMYPGGRGEYASLPGCGLLRLHSTYRHDLKIYASDEGRVQMTAAAFAKVLVRPFSS